MAMYVFGFAVKASERHFETIINRYCWIYLLIGAVSCTGYGMMTPILAFPDMSLNFWQSSAVDGFV